MTTETKKDRHKTARLANIARAQEKLAELRKEGRNTYESNALKRLQRTPANLRRAVIAVCFVCQGGTLDTMPTPGWQRRIAFCPKSDCPVYWCRPHAGKFNHADDDDEGGEV